MRWRLRYDNDRLADNEMILANVEPEIQRHPQQFKELDILLKFISKGIAKCLCGFVIRRQDLRYYAGHENGLLVPYEDIGCWIYSHCPNCGYDFNFQKIMAQKSWYDYRMHLKK